MKNFRWAALLVVFLTACSSSSTSPTSTTPSLVFKNLYVTQFAQAGAQLLIYTPPFSSGEAPAVTLSDYTTSAPGGITFNNAGTAFIINQINTGSDITAFGHPISSASTPRFDIPLAGTVNAYNAVDSKGNLWFSDRANDTLSVLNAPFSATSVPAFSITTPGDPAQMAFDKAGDMAVATQGSEAVLFYTAPLSATSVPAAVIPLGTQGQGVVFDKAGNIYATLFGNGGGSGIAVFTPPFSNASTPSFTIPTPVGPENLAFDNHGNLWDTDPTPEAVEWSPPFSATSTPALTMNNGFTTQESSLAFGP